MDRVKGLGSLGIITVVVFLGLRVVHVGVPLVFPNTRPGPFPLTSLDDVERRVGFAPLLPAYRPASLGERPVSLIVSFNPQPTFAVVWRSAEYVLSVTQRQGGPMPAHPPISQPLLDVPDSTWWMDGTRCHLVLARGGFWVEIETDLPPRDLKRLADTLTRY